MKVMQVLAGAKQGGAEAAFEDISLALSAAGVEQKIIVRNNNPDRIKKFRDAGIEVETLPFGGPLDIYTSWKLKKIIADFKPQIVQTWMSRATSKTPSSKEKNYIKLARLGGYYPLKYYRGTDYYVAATPDIRDYLIREVATQEHVSVIPNFANEESVARPITKSDLNTPEDSPVVLSLARYHTAKALDVLISAAAKIDNLHVWLAGEGPEESALKKHAADLGVGDRIHFLGWRSDRAALLRAADICVFPSRHEPFGTVFVQAWAQHTPLICSRSQGPSQYVTDGYDGLMFDIDNVDQLVEKISMIIADPDLGNKLADAGYQTYQKKFTREKIIADYLAYYSSIIAREGLDT